LAKLDKALSSAPNLEALPPILQKHLEDEVRLLEDDAAAEIERLNVDAREQVRAYYAPLWVWHRLDADRWKMSSIPLRLRARKEPSWDVDHVISVKLWENMPIGAGPGEADIDEDLANVVNQIGNSVLLEKTFNISKGAKPLKAFLDEVVEFKTGKVPFDAWATALALEPSHSDPTGKTRKELAALIEKRSALIRAELVEFIRGARSRVAFDALQPVMGVEDRAELRAVEPAAATETAAKGKRDLIKIDFMKRLKQRFWKPPLSEKYACWGTRGRSYSCFFSIAEKGDIYFGLDWDNPYLSVPKDDGYDTSALTGLNWKDNEKGDERWYDFGPVDLGNAEQSSQLIERIIEVLGNIKVVEHAE
jgi:hypothetical protein